MPRWTSVEWCALVLATGASLACEAPAQSRSTVTWSVDSATISGELRLPSGNGPFPAVIVVAGSGTIGVDHPINRLHADRLSESGYAVLTYDKRGVGKSSGSWRSQSLADRASDIRGALELLRADPRIDPRRIGLIGHSQGGWIAPMVAARDTAIAFLVLLASTPLSPLDQSVWITEHELASSSLSIGHRRAIIELQRRVFQVYAGRADEASVRAELDSAREQPWFNERLLGMQPDTSWNRRWLARLPFDYDVSPILRSLRLPVLVVNGELDRVVPAAQSQGMFRDLLRENAARVTFVMLPGVGHTLGRTDRDPPVDEYWGVLRNWISPRK